jgi:imidazolonepropionase-like amidohydrolase
VWPQDPGFSRALANGGVTTLQILPGSANLFGGRSVVLKNVPARTVQGMKFPGAPYGLKMACGENPKRVYGNKGGPQTRMGNIAVTRATWLKAQEYKRKWDKYEKNGGDMPSRDLAMDTLRGVLEGKILVHNHCYRADEMAIMIDMSKEFGYHVTAFHHAVEAYKIADLLAANDICAVMWADWYGFKMESYDAIKENIPLVHNAGACAIVHSDDANYIQRLNQEASKALADGIRAGIPGLSEAVAWEWLSRNPAKALGILDKTGTLAAGKEADVVLWNGDPFSDYSRPDRVWIDGAEMYDASNPRKRPVSDFELGQPGEGDTK